MRLVISFIFLPTGRHVQRSHDWGQPCCKYYGSVKQNDTPAYRCYIYTLKVRTTSPPNATPRRAFKKDPRKKINWNVYHCRGYTASCAALRSAARWKLGKVYLSRAAFFRRCSVANHDSQKSHVILTSEIISLIPHAHFAVCTHGD